MSEELIFSGKTYTSSKRAAEISGYAQDYIGQLARKGLVAAERVGNLWYVSMESLNSYQQNAESFAPQTPTERQKSTDSLISLDGNDYISAAAASKLTGYNQDYIGQLARSGKILSRQIGNRWYVDRDALLAHKRHKDALLGAVQAEAVGLPPRSFAAPLKEEHRGPVMQYFTEESDLMPVFQKQEARPLAEPAFTLDLAVERSIPIRTIHTPRPVQREENVVRGHRNTMFLATRGAFALTVVIVLTYGMVSLKDSARYAFAPWDKQEIDMLVENVAATASASEGIDKLGAWLEKYLSPALTYKRSE